MNIHAHLEKRMFWKVLRHVFVPSSGLDENNIKGAFNHVVPYPRQLLKSNFATTCQLAVIGVLVVCPLNIC